MGASTTRSPAVALAVLLASSLSVLTACAAEAPALGTRDTRADPTMGGTAARADASRFRVATFATGLEHPWGADFLPDGRLLVTERPGRLRLIGRDGRVGAPISGVPPVVAEGQGGLLDVRLAPDFASSRDVFLCLSAWSGDGALTRLARGRLSEDGATLEGTRALLDFGPAQRNTRGHYGCRIAFGADGAVFVTSGDRMIDKRRAQRPGDLAGKLVRVDRDGRALPDNPFADGRGGMRPEIWSLGHRSPQGLAVEPATGTLWQAEMGPRGGDEVNVIRRGGNYGWPVVGQGVDYDGSRIHEAASRPGMVDPVRWWVPVISPSGANFYSGDRFPEWRGSLFLAGLNPASLTRLSVADGRVTAEERIIVGGPRLRHVLGGPDGLIYLLTDEGGGRVLRLEPAG